MWWLSLRTTSNPRFNSGLVDLMLHVLANITEMSLLVFYTHMDGVRNMYLQNKVVLDR